MRCRHCGSAANGGKPGQTGVRRTIPAENVIDLMPITDLGLPPRDPNDDDDEEEEDDEEHEKEPPVVR
jgi:hypothetical protein